MFRTPGYSRSPMGSPLSSAPVSPTSTIRSVDSGYAPTVSTKGSPKPSSLASLSIAPGHALRSPIALFSDITLRGSPKDESRRSRASSCASALLTPNHHQSHHRHHKSPRSPQDAKMLFSHARQKATADMASVTDEIISRQSEILSRKHDIAVWQRKIHAAEKLIAGMQEQVDGLVREAREKQDVERELEGQMNAIMTAERLSEREWAALGNCLDHLDLGGGEGR